MLPIRQEVCVWTIASEFDFSTEYCTVLAFLCCYNTVLLAIEIRLCHFILKLFKHHLLLCHHLSAWEPAHMYITIIWNLWVSINWMASGPMEPLYHPLEKWESAGVGRHLPTHPGTFIHQLCYNGSRSSGRWGWIKEEGQVCTSGSQALFCSCGCRISWVFGIEAWCCFQDLGCSLKDFTSEYLSHHYLIQRISVAVQSSNMAPILTLAVTSVPFIPN